MQNHKGKSMANILQNQNLPESLSQKNTKLSQEELKNFDGNQSLTLLHHSTDNPVSYRPAPRVKPEAHTNAQGAKGKQIATSG